MLLLGPTRHHEVHLSAHRAQGRRSPGRRLRGSGRIGGDQAAIASRQPDRMSQRSDQAGPEPTACVSGVLRSRFGTFGARASTGAAAQHLQTTDISAGGSATNARDSLQPGEVNPIAGTAKAARGSGLCPRSLPALEPRNRGKDAAPTPNPRHKISTPRTGSRPASPASISHHHPQPKPERKPCQTRNLCETT